jgi:hypothetical protein
LALNSAVGPLKVNSTKTKVQKPKTKAPRPTVS